MIIREIAEQAGVSMTTVYNVPKLGLRALKNNSSKIIGVVIHSSRYYENSAISDTFYSHISAQWKKCFVKPDII